MFVIKLNKKIFKMKKYAKKFVLNNYSKKKIFDLHKNQYFDLYFKNSNQK